ncbi:MAG: SapC family protein [Pseudomonadota bacterium]
MATLSPLNPQEHGHLKVKPSRMTDYAAPRHMIPLRVTELTQATSCFPVFISRLEGQGTYAISALTSMTPGKNLFVDGENWDATFVPSDMRTFPIGLMNPPNEGDEPPMGIDPTMDVFSETQGEPLFGDDGQPSLWVTQTKAQLFDDAQNSVRTHQFLQKLDELGLIVPVTIGVKMASGDVNRIAGLHTINEDALNGLSTDAFEGLRTAGYLPPIYALLFSIVQLNALIQRTNKKDGAQKIDRIGVERSKAPSAL